MSWDVLATNLPYMEIYGSAGSLAVGNPDEFDGEPRLRRADAEDLRQPPPPPGSVHWSPIPMVRPHGARRGVGIADIAEAIDEDRPHRASGELACHVLEVLLALAEPDPDRTGIPIGSRCARPASF